MKASTLGLLGRIDEGEKFAEKLLDHKPSFANIGRDLIERYIKFDEIVEYVIEGLCNSGLTLE